MPADRGQHTTTTKDIPARSVSSATANTNKSMTSTTNTSMTTSEELVLVLDGGRAAVTLRDDGISVPVTSQQVSDGRSFYCCGLVTTQAEPVRFIPYFNLVWAEAKQGVLVLHHARRVSKKRDDVQMSTLHFYISNNNTSHPTQTQPQRKATNQDDTSVQKWINRALSRAYEDCGAQRQKRLKVIINPKSGKGNATKLYYNAVAPIFAAARCSTCVETTARRGHAQDIAAQLDIDNYDSVVCCSGDGTPHEVFNGLARKTRARAALTQTAVVNIPCGSGNAMSLNLNGTGSASLAALCIVKGRRTQLDLTTVTQGDRRLISFLSQTIGIVAQADLGTEHLRWMGSARFTYGFLKNIIRKTSYPCDIDAEIKIDSKEGIKDHFRTYSREACAVTAGATNAVDTSPDSKTTPQDDAAEDGLPILRLGSATSQRPATYASIPAHNISTFYAGNMPLMAPDVNFFPAALPHDGLLDLVAVNSDIGRWNHLNCLLAVGKGTFFELPFVKYLKASSYRVTPHAATKGYIAIDGEEVPFEPFQAEVHKGLGCTLSRHGRVYAAENVLPREK